MCHGTESRVNCTVLHLPVLADPTMRVSERMANVICQRCLTYVNNSLPNIHSVHTNCCNNFAMSTHSSLSKSSLPNVASHASLQSRKNSESLSIRQGPWLSTASHAQAHREQAPLLIFICEIFDLPYLLQCRNILADLGQHFLHGTPWCPITTRMRHLHFPYSDSVTTTKAKRRSLVGRPRWKPLRR